MVCSFSQASFAEDLNDVATPALNKENLEKFVDQFATLKMATKHIPGIVVVITNGKETLVSKGYGSSNLKYRVKMDPGKTLLRVGSISKIITATMAIMQYSFDKFELTSDIRELVEPQILKRYPKDKKITYLSLLNHTAGFGDRFVGQAYSDPNDLKWLRDYLIKNMPEPVDEDLPGIIYSNFHITLLGYIIEKLSGESYYQASENQMFKPLGMSRSTFIPDKNGLTDVATGYNYIFGDFRSLPLYHWATYPASSLITSGEDMNKFLKVHLNRGKYLDKKSELQKLWDDIDYLDLFRRTNSLENMPAGVSHGFWERWENGQKILWHSGHMPGHRSGFYILPETNIGLFIYNNSEYRLYNEFISEFLDEFFPKYSALKIKINDSTVPVDLSIFSGNYRHTWYPRDSLGKICVLTGAQGWELKIADDQNSNVLLSGKDRLRHIGDNKFKSDNSDTVYAFIKNQDGEITGFYQDGVESYEKVNFLRSARFHQIILILLYAIFTITFIHLVSFYIRPDLRKKLKCRPPKARFAHFLATMLTGCHVFFFYGTVYLVSNGIYKLVQVVPISFKLLLSIPIISFVFLFFLGLCLTPVKFLILEHIEKLMEELKEDKFKKMTKKKAVKSKPNTKRRPSINKSNKSYYAYLIIVSIILYGFLNYWKILGFRF